MIMASLTVDGLRVKEHLRIADAVLGNRNDVTVPPALASTSERSQLAHGGGGGGARLCMSAIGSRCNARGFCRRRDDGNPVKPSLVSLVVCEG